MSGIITTVFLSSKAHSLLSLLFLLSSCSIVMLHITEIDREPCDYTDVQRDHIEVPLKKDFF